MNRHAVHLAVGTVALAVVGGGVWAAAASGADRTSAAPPATGTVLEADSDARVTEPLRAEHAELLPSIEGLESAGNAVGRLPKGKAGELVHASYTFLADGLIPHAVAEDQVLYAKVDQLLGTDTTMIRTTDTMRRDHTEVVALTEELEGLAGDMHERKLTKTEEQQLRSVLYQLHGIVELHFAKEEEVYLPLLDEKLSAADAQAMFEEMERVSAEHGGGGHDH